MKNMQTARHRKVAAFLVGVASMGVVLAGCAQGASGGQGAESQPRLTQVTSADPAMLNPALPGGATDKNVGCMIYQGLTRVDKDYVAQPQLAREWEISDDGKVYTFELEHANFTDGEAMTADDVVYSLTEIVMKYSSSFAAAAAAIESVEAPDEDTVQITLKHPFGPLLLSLSCDLGGTAVLPKHVYEGTDPATNPASLDAPVGTGPFVLGEWDRGAQLTLERNPDYWRDGLPLLDEVVYKVMPSAGARTIALMSGEVDYIYHYFVDRNGLSTVEKDDRYEVTDRGAAGDYNMIFNVRNAPYDDVRVRQALLMAIDRDFIVESAMKGYGSAAKSAISTAMEWAYNPDVDLTEKYPYDPEAARQLLEEAGATGLKVRLAYDSTNQVLPAMADAIAAFWKEVGVETSLQGAERAVTIENVFQKSDFDVTIQGYTSMGDPALGIARIYVTDSIGKSFGNASGYSNPAVDELFAAGANETSQEDRAVSYFEVQELLADEIPSVPLVENPSLHAAAKGVKHMYDGLQQYGDWWDGVSLEK